MKRKVIAVIGVVVVVLGTYLFTESIERVAPKENKALDIEQLVQDYSIGHIKNQSASITSQQLIVTDSDESQLTYDLPEENFFVSIAPYVEKTHPCSIHSLTGCRGEMVEEEFKVYIEDVDGNVLLDQTLISQSNGFIDLWLPRNRTYRVTIAHDGKTAESEFSTFESDNTCITTMQLMEKKSA